MAASSSTAPGRLETVRRLVNTRDVEADRDDLATPADLREWLCREGLLPGGADVGPADLDRAVALREALRAALAANHDGGPVPAGAVAVLNDVAARARLSLSFGAGPGWVARPAADGVDGALGALLVLVVEAMTDGTWPRLKVCDNTACRWAYYDRSRARTGRWCSMRVCGNRAKQRGWRERHATADGAPAAG
jgi:predicted RNA-binding Zn ribbon-like protein